MSCSFQMFDGLRAVVCRFAKSKIRAQHERTVFFFFFFFFFWWWALTLPPRISKEAKSALWLTSHGAPLDCRRSTKSSAGWGFAEPGTSKGHNIVMARWIDDDPKVICRSDPSSRDSIEPIIRSQVSKHPPGKGSVILRGSTTVFC